MSRLADSVDSKALGLMSCVLAMILFAAPACTSASIVSTPMRDSCVLIDNDYDIDDMKAIPLVIGNKYVAALIQSEGYTLPEHSAPAVDELINNLADQRNNRQIPIIVGASQSSTRDISAWWWLPFFRSMMNHSNALLATAPEPWSSDSEYVQKVVGATTDCKNVSVLILGTWTSFINYSPLIRNKIDKVVVMGQPIGDLSRTPERESFNCDYDLPACQTAMMQLQDLNAYFVDIPRDNGDDPNLPKGSCSGMTRSPNCYQSSFEMVAGGNGSPGIAETGLAGRLKQALTNPIDCSDKFTDGMPAVPSAPQSQCSGLSTWVPANVAAGPGVETLLWDETAALFLVRPEAFSLYETPNDPAIGGKHWEPTLVNNSYSETAEYLRELWTELTNNAAQPRNE